MVLNLVRHLPSRFEPRVCCIHHAGPMGEEIRATGVPVDVLGLNPGFRRPFDVARIRRYFLKHQPHVVHTFLMTGSLYGRLAAILAGVRVVIGTEVNIYARKPWRHIVGERLLMMGTDRVIASAATVREAYLRQLQADADKVEVIYNAVDWSQLHQSVAPDALRASIGIPVDAKVAGIIARLNEQKGHTHLLEALATEPRLADVHLMIVGDGELATDLRHDADRLNLARRVHFLGARRDLGNLLAAMDVFVLPSLWEGLPLSLVLAMGAGIPVIATSVGGVPEVVQDGRTGLLVPPGDPAALGQALARAFDDRALRDRLAGAASAAVRSRFGVDQYIDSIVDLYDRLLSQHEPAGAEARA